MGYYHFLPPHGPYRTRSDFYDIFANDGYQPTPKPIHPLSRDIGNARLNEMRRWYDEYIPYADAEFARLYENLEKTGLLENTWLILTSDHGEIFERGIIGHITPIYHQPMLKIPLLIFPPGQSTRVDIYDKTSAIDLLPTLLHVTNQDIPEWTEGMVLPPFSSSNALSERDISTIHVEKFAENGSIAEATVVYMQGDYKLMWYFGYEQLEEDTEFVELYDLTNDPDEEYNLSTSHKNIANDLLESLKEKVQKLNDTYQ